MFLTALALAAAGGISASTGSIIATTGLVTATTAMIHEMKN